VFTSAPFIIRRDEAAPLQKAEVHGSLLSLAAIIFLAQETSIAMENSPVPSLPALFLK